MYRSKNQLGARAHTLGVIVDWVGDPYQVSVFQGIAEAAAHCGANVLYFVGGALPMPGSAPDVSRHRIYELAGAHNVDGLVLMSSTLIHDVGLEGLKEFAGHFSGLPLCSVGVALAGATCVTVDNAEGIRALVHHLVDNHGARRIAFVSGPEENAESQLRQEAYSSALRDRGIPVDDALLVAGDFTSKSGRAAVHILAKRVGLESLQAIVAANDQMAIGVTDELEHMNVTVPARIAVTGFDDIDDARLAQPPLTTVRQPLSRQGREAVRLVSQAIVTRSQQHNVQTATELVVRSSCGCGSTRTAASVAPPAASRKFLVSIMGRRSRIAAKLGRVARGALLGATSGWEDQLLGALIEDVQSGQLTMFPDTFSKVADRWMAGGADLRLVEGVITALRREIAPLLGAEPAKRDVAEELFHVARLITSEHARRHLERTQREVTRGSRTLALACNALSAAYNFESLRRRIKEHVPQLGVRSCFVALYNEIDSPSKARLFAAFDQAGPDPGCEGASFDATHLLPPDLIETKGPGRSFAVLPLACNMGMLGHALFEYHEKNAFACGVLSEAITIAVRGARLSGERW